MNILKQLLVSLYLTFVTAISPVALPTPTPTSIPVQSSSPVPSPTPFPTPTAIPSPTPTPLSRAWTHENCDFSQVSKLPPDLPGSNDPASTESWKNFAKTMNDQNEINKNDPNFKCPPLWVRKENSRKSQNRMITMPTPKPTGFGTASNYNQIGDTLYGSDGSSYRQLDNTMMGNNGTSYNTNGTFSYGSDGTTYIRNDNALYGNNGTNCIQIGSSWSCSGGQ